MKMVPCEWKGRTLYVCCIPRGCVEQRTDGLWGNSTYLSLGDPCDTEAEARAAVEQALGVVDVPPCA